MIVVSTIVNRPGYPEQVGDALIVVDEKAYAMHGQSCDLLIFGDSSAATGIDPRVLTADGFSVCDISATQPVANAFGTMTVDVFLSRNPRPKMLLLQLSPEAFYREPTWDHLALYSPYTLLLRDAPRSVLLSTLARHPVASVRAERDILNLWWHRNNPAQQQRIKPFFDRTLATYRETGGLLVLLGPAQTACNEPNAKLYAPVDKRWIEQVRQKYEAQGIAVIVRSSPIPDCDPQLDFFQRDLAPSLDAKIDALPIHLFLPGDRHMTEAGAVVASHQLAGEIHAVLAARARP